MSVRTWQAFAGAAGIAASLASAAAWAAPSSTDLIPLKAGARAQSVAALAAGAPSSMSCITAVAQSMRSERLRGTPAQRRAFAAFAGDPVLLGERLALGADGTAVRFTTDRNAVDRVESTDENANGRPDAVDEIFAGAGRAQRLLVGQLELPSPGSVEFVLSRLGSGVDGLSMPGSARQPRTHIWLDSALRSGPAGIRRAAEHQYAHLVASAAGLDTYWGEAFATWAALTLEPSADERTLSSLASRFAAAGAGLATQDLDIASGNAAWFAFLNDAYGPTAVKLAVEELGRGGSDQAALDRATQRATGDGLDAVLRNFQVWTVLVGPRDDRKHFSFASRLPGPVIAATAGAFPALSVQTEPEVGPMGQAAILLRPDELGGGLTVRFEGDLAARWAADLLLVRVGGEMRRVPVALDAEDSGEISVPLQDVREILLLVRNLDSEGHPARRYSWGAQVESGFPTEFSAVRAEATREATGALVSWDTATERGLLGFNVLRSRSERGEAIRVNPVWIPAIGETSGPASYSFFDAGIEPGVSYRYRIEAVTLEGLAARSDGAALSSAP